VRYKVCASRGAAVGYRWVSRRFRCVCGKGVIVGVTWENDGKQSHGKLSDWQIECADCAKHFVFEPRKQNLIRPSDGRRIPLESLIRIDKPKV